MRKSSRVLVSLALLLCALVEVEAGSVYEFTKVSSVPFGDSQRSQAPVVNDSGMVAFMADQGIYRGGGSGAPSLIPDTYRTGPRSLSINDAGMVSFTRFSPDSFASQYLVNDGSTSQPILTMVDSYSSAAGTSINNLGSVVLGLQTRDDSVTGIYLSQNGQTASRIYTPGNGTRSFDVDPVINDGSQIAFLAIGGSSRTLLLGNTAGAAPTVLARDADFASSISERGNIWGGYDLNDRGQVAFISSVVNNDAAVPVKYGIHIASTSGIATIATFLTHQGIFTEDGVALNNSGTIAFWLDQEGLGGIYTGGNLIEDKVIKAGDRLDGGRVLRLQFGRFGLNERDQLAFHATVLGDDGVVREGIYLATPVTAVPEPSTLSGLGVGLVGASLALGRRRAMNKG